MPVLANQRHETFAQNLAAGMTQTAAYLAINPTASTKTAMEAGSRLARSVKVSERVKELTLPALVASKASAQWIVDEAVRIVEAGNPKDRVAALSLLAKRFPEFRDGPLVDQSQHVHIPEGATLEDLRQLRASLDANAHQG